MMEWVVFLLLTLSPAGPSFPLGRLFHWQGSFSGTLFASWGHLTVTVTCRYNNLVLSFCIPLSLHLSIRLSLSLIHASIPLSWSCHHAECVPGLERDGCCQAQGTGCSSGSINSAGPACDITCLRQDNHDESLQSKLHTEEQRAASTQPNCDSLLSSAFFFCSLLSLHQEKRRKTVTKRETNAPFQNLVRCLRRQRLRHRRHTSDSKAVPKDRYLIILPRFTLRQQRI